MPWLIAAIAALVLLLAFQQVVSRVAQQGAARRQAQTAHVQATWRCRTIGDAGLRRDCLAQLVPAWPRDTAHLPRRPTPTR
jgi:hypothetical protein